MADLRYTVDLGGRLFNVERKGRFGRRSIPLQKAQQDTSSLPGEQSLNPEDLWRRSFESWHRGAGQSWFDWKDGDPFRFDGSLGVDPWTKKQLGLLNETETKLASTASTVKLAVAGSYLYCIDGQTLKYTTTITVAGAATWTTVSGTPAATAQSITSDGFRVWVAYGASGIYATTRGAAAASMYTDVPATVVEFVKGRLMVGNGDDLYNVTSSARIGGIAFRGVTTDSTDTAVASKTVSYPSGIQPGDLVVVYVTSTTADTKIDNDVGWDALDGETFAGGTAVLWNIFTRSAPGDGTTSFTVTTRDGSSQRMLVVCVAYASAESTALHHSFDVDAGSTNQNPATASVPLSATSDNSFLVLWAAAVKGGSVTATVPTDPASNTYTERADIQTATASLSLSVDDLLDPFAGEGLDVITGHLSSGAFTTGPHVSVWEPSDTPEVLFTQPSADFTWVGFAEGQGDIYAAGYSGDKSLIYRTQVRADGTALDAPVVAGSLPDGEIVRSIYGYLGIVFIGTDNGLRMAVSDANGDLTIGALIETASPVRCFEGQGRFVWFGLEDYDISRWGSGTYDGLGRLDLTQQIEQLVPAWASDLMAAASTSTTESVQSIVTFQDRRLFAIGSSNSLTRGVYGEKPNRVANGYLDSGLITYGISDTKVATYLDVRHKALPSGSDVQAYVSTDEGAFTSIGTSSTPSSTRPATDPMPVGPTRGDVHEVRVRLGRASSSDAVGPVLTRATLRSEPAPARGRIRQWPLVLTTNMTVGRQAVGRDPVADLAFIEGLFDTQTLITCREDNATFTAFLKDYEFVAEHPTPDGKAEHGICTVTLKEPAS